MKGENQCLKSNISLPGAARVVTESSAQSSQFAVLEQKKVSRFELEEETTSQAPVFTTSMKNQDLREGQRAHFEARIIPVSDPTLKVEWLQNGQPIKQGTRFREGHDFGFVSLDIMQVHPDDAGQYTCRATNVLGQAVCSANINIQANIMVDTETIHEAAQGQIHFLEQAHTRQREEEGFTTQVCNSTACGVRSFLRLLWKFF